MCWLVSKIIIDLLTIWIISWTMLEIQPFRGQQLWRRTRNFLLIFTLLAFQAKGVMSLPVSVRLSVGPSIRKLYLVRTKTHAKFKLESPNLHQTCILWYSWLVLKMEVIDPDFQGHFGHFNSIFLEIRLVHTITHHRFGLESPNLHQMCTLGYARWVLKMEVIDLDLQGNFGHWTQNSRKFGLSAR